MNTPRLIYDYLYTQNLSSDKIEEVISNYSKDQIIKLINKLNEIVPFSETKDHSKFNLIANTSLSGSPSQCSNLECRSSNLSTLMRKSILYADKVWIKYPLDKYKNHDLEISDLEDLRESVIHDLIIIHQVRLLIESGIFEFAVSKKHFCFDCFGSLSSEVEWPMVEEVKALKDILKETYAFGANYRVRRIGSSKWDVEIKAKDNELFYHDKLFYAIDDVKKEFPNALLRYSKKIIPKEIIQSKQVNRLVNHVLENIVMQNWYSQNIGANYVTNIPIELTSAKILANDIRDIDFNYDGLEHALPTIKEVGISKLIELRKKSPEAFVNYRNSFDKVMEESRNLDITLQQELISSELNPIIDQLSQNIKTHKDKLIKGTLHNLVIGSSMVAVSVFPGLLPIGIAASTVSAAAGIGAIHQSKELLKGLKGLTTREFEEKDNKYYFLWKALN